MKKKVDKNVLNESCFIMNIPKTLSTADGNHISNNISEDSKISLQNTLTPPQSITSSPNTKIKCEQENSIDPSEDVDVGDEKISPPPSSLGPGAEIKGKICHPIPSGSSGAQLDESESLDEITRSASAGNTSSGGRLTFFKEGKLLLELSHRSEQGSWVQVKSKTYWPPPSTTTTTTTIQHPLRHDTPTTHSDDCSSINSSPWASEHVRKQLGPNPRNKVWLSTDHLFYLKRSPHIRDVRRRVRLRRNPHSTIVETLNYNSSNSGKNSASSEFSLAPAFVKDMKFIDRKKRLERTVSRLGRRSSLKLDDNVSIRSLFERVTAESFVSENAASSGMDPTFITPRKRYLRTLETDFDSHLRKKVHSGSNSISGSGVGCLPSSQLTKHHCDSRLSSFPSSSPSSVSSPSSSPSPLLYAAPKSANSSSSSSSQNASAYSIDSLLSSESSSSSSSSSSENVIRKGDSFLRTLLKPDKPLPRSSSSSSSHGRHGPSLPIRDRTTADASSPFHSVKRLDKDRDRGLGSSPYPKEVLAINSRASDPKKVSLPDRYDLTNTDLSSAVRFGSPHPFYLNPYFDPRYMVFSPLSAATTTPPPSSFLPGAVSQSGSDMASAVAVAAAAAAAAGYPITPWQLTAGLASGVYPPATSLASHLIRSPNPNRSSPHSVPHSPSPKLSPAPPALPLSPQFGMAGSPRDMWTPSSIPNSPQKYPNTSSVSPPPQDVPLNLSKPKRKC